MFPSFHIFGWEVGTYGIMVVLGAVACTFVGNNLIKRFGRDIYDFLLILLSIGAGIFIGAHIVYGITHLDLIIKAFQNIGELWFDKFRDVMIYAIGGMVFYGGFLTPCSLPCFTFSAESAAFSAAAATELNLRSASPFTAIQ